MHCFNPAMEILVDCFHTEPEAKPLKPLAILATVDLRPKARNASADVVMGAEKVRESSATVVPSEETKAVCNINGCSDWTHSSRRSTLIFLNNT